MQFLLPECFYEASTVTELRASNLILIGSTSSNGYIDPLTRFPPSLVTISVRNSVLRDGPFGGSGSTLNWTNFFTLHPLLTELVLDNVGLQGPLPILPANMSTMSLPNNRLMGSLNSSIFNAVATTLPKHLIFNVSGNNLTGSIPEDLFQTLDTPNNIESFLFDVSSNHLNGTIPGGMFDSSSFSNLSSIHLSFAYNDLQGSIASNLLPSVATLSNVTLNVSANVLTGTIPAEVLDSSINLKAVTFDASFNKLTGSVPIFLASMTAPSLDLASFDLSHNSLSGVLPVIAPSSSFGALTSITWILSFNRISGALSPSLFGPTGTMLLNWNLDVSHNLISGDLPSTFFTLVNPTLLTWRCSFAANNLVGSIPSNFFDAVPSSMTKIELDLSSNDLQGSLPPAFLKAYSEDSTATNRHLLLNLANCTLIGAIPTTLLGSLTSCKINLDNNSLSGSYAWEDLIYNATTNYATLVDISAANNQLEGELILPSAPANFSLYLNLASNNLLDISVGTVDYLNSLIISDNPLLEGNILQQILKSPATVFKASATALSGKFPDLSNLTHSSLTTLDLSDTKIEFCGRPQSPWRSSNLTQCLLYGTSAYYCSSLYPSICEKSLPSPDIPIPPDAEPVTSPIVSVEPMAQPEIQTIPTSTPNPPSTTPVGEPGPAFPSLTPTPASSASSLASSTFMIATMLWIAFHY